MWVFDEICVCHEEFEAGTAIQRMSSNYNKSRLHWNLPFLGSEHQRNSEMWRSNLYVRT